MDWKQGLDKYLTKEPEDDFTPFCEKLYEFFDSEFYEEISKEPNSFEDSKTANKWLNKLFDESFDPEQGAIIFKRAYRMFVKIN